MLKTFTVVQLDSKTVAEIENIISALSKAKGSNKRLPLVLNGTCGDFKLAIDLARKFRASGIKLSIEAHGLLDSAGTILATLGEKGERRASLDAVFTPFESNEKSIRKDRLTPKNQSVLATLGSLKANRRRLKSIASKAENLSSFEARALNIIDSVDGIDNAVEEKPRKVKTFRKSSGKKSSKR